MTDHAQRNIHTISGFTKCCFIARVFMISRHGHVSRPN